MIAEGHGVVSASNGHTASTLLQSLDLSKEKLLFDLIILSWMLPKVDGQELCRWLSHQASFGPILVLSTKESEVDQISVLEAGADDYLLKPFDTQELIACCRALLRRPHLGRLPEPIVLQFEELSLYPQEHRVLVRGKEVYLSPKEFGLLKLLMNHPGRVWSRQELFEQLWEPNFAGIPKNVDVHIRRLRQKLELRPGQPKYLTTVPKIGYRLG